MKCQVDDIGREGISCEINRDNAFSTAEAYVHHVVANMTNDELSALETSYITYYGC